ncbi:PQ-loop domain-containing transporter [Bradyrhizobium australiense]|uniref:PQ-loop domain-containing transporter n=1 Tax=Bradyrhizobium australiense TaxID=2721161 RepID=UPI001EEAFC4D|nr:PQ-loop domain-containing transporter [Bradyrhizobium australiense]
MAAGPLLSSLSYIPQVREVRTGQSTEDLSRRTLIALTAGLALWVLYGAHQGPTGSSLQPIWSAPASPDLCSIASCRRAAAERVARPRLMPRRQVSPEGAGSSSQFEPMPNRLNI